MGHQVAFERHEGAENASQFMEDERQQIIIKFSRHESCRASFAALLIDQRWKLYQERRMPVANRSSSPGARCSHQISPDDGWLMMIVLWCSISFESDAMRQAPGRSEVLVRVAFEVSIGNDYFTRAHTAPRNDMSCYGMFWSNIERSANCLQTKNFHVLNLHMGKQG